MTTRTYSEKLDPIVDFLDGLSKRATIEELEALLTPADITEEDIAEFAQFGIHNYRRNLVREGKWYHLLILCWRSGQRSPIHNHAQSTCGFRVIKGRMTETKFVKTPSGLLKPTTSAELEAGGVCASQDSDTHQVSNLEAPDQDLITLHIYSPPLVRMETYSLTDATVGTYVPVTFSHMHGSGI